MAWSSRTVLIPLATPTYDRGSIARIQADGGRPVRDEVGLNPQIAELGDWNLYEAGAIALGAIRRLGLRPRGLGLTQRFRPGVVSGYLSATNGPDLRGLASENTRSAELGLALGLLMYAGQSRDRIVIATGCLARDTGPNSDPSDDVAVQPVGEINGKIEALIRSLDAQKGGAYARRVLFFLPIKTLSGESTPAAHAGELRGLREAFREKCIEIEVCPVASLHEALRKLGIDALETTAADRLLARGFAGVLVAAAVSLLFYRWLVTPLDLAFAVVPLTTGEEVLSPVRAVYDTRDGAFRMREACFGEQRLPVYRAGESLVFRAVLKARSPLVQALGGYHFAVVGVSEESGLKVYPPETFRAFGPRRPLAASEVQARLEDFDLSAVLPIVGPREKSKLIVLVRKLSPFDTKALHDFLTSALIGRQPAERINTVVTRLAGFAPGYVDYSFQSVEDETECAPK
jgi:hypothetical protein